ncbi:BON domain-containing protein [Ferrovum sp. PN-J185]|uniref:BON domain-containing protein n=1 Tax=Ferrovum sp. PN-J185 TaxID=1356306 RepID=UPI0007956887|nr:BON domain-containing protein [Ferrovum sp. PN-J185]KXW55674.1 outer membrane lipoprotein [Ferrovum sp. PN-J185]MCC6068823.1 BON domain-containing protein [Ferrovum sp. PN-J185]
MKKLSITRKLTTTFLMLVSVPLLQACFPIVATGIVGTGFVVADRRTSATQLEDQEIELRANNAIDQKYMDKVHVVPVSYNRHLLLVGEVPDSQTLSDVVAIAKQTTNVQSVINQLTVGPNLSLSSRAEDTYITSKVKARFYGDANGTFSPVHVETTTENHVVYLMGMLTRNEADSATQIASTTSGVSKVVRVFEYIAHVPDSEKLQDQSGTKANTSSKPEDVQAPAPSQDVLPNATSPVPQ